MKKYENQTDGIQYLLVAIARFSKKASVHRLKNKEGVSMKKALVKVLKKFGDLGKIQFDKGLESARIRKCKTRRLGIFFHK